MTLHANGPLPRGIVRSVGSSWRTYSRIKKLGIVHPQRAAAADGEWALRVVGRESARIASAMAGNFFFAFVMPTTHSAERSGSDLIDWSAVVRARVRFPFGVEAFARRQSNADITARTRANRPMSSGVGRPLQKRAAIRFACLCTSSHGGCWGEPDSPRLIDHNINAGAGLSGAARLQVRVGRELFPTVQPSGVERAPQQAHRFSVGVKASVTSEITRAHLPTRPFGESHRIDAGHGLVTSAWNVLNGVEVAGHKNRLLTRPQALPQNDTPELLVKPSQGWCLSPTPARRRGATNPLTIEQPPLKF